MASAPALLAALAVATAMLRLTLPHVTTGLFLWGAQTGDGISLQATYVTGNTSAPPAIDDQQAAADLMLIDSIATHWGHRGDQHTQTLWALLF